MRVSLMYLVLTLLQAVFMLGIYATGDPIIKIKITPIATAEGYALFSTQSYQNPLGSYTYNKIDFGWLIVRSHANKKFQIWDERKSYQFDGKDTDDPKYQRYLTGKVNLETPDEVLLQIIKKYPFDRNSKLINQSPVVAIKPHQTCFLGYCIERSYPQQTLGKVKSIIAHTPVRSSFYYDGIALFHNIYSVGSLDGPKEAKQIGSSFNFEQSQWIAAKPDKEYPKKYPFSYIDGLVIIDQFDFMKQAILEELNTHFSRCEKQANLINRYQQAHETWELCETDKLHKSVKVTYKKKNIIFSEIYFIRNNQLIYAKEQQEQTVDSGTVGIWNVSILVKDEKQTRVISSLGHGKTEDDNWDPESILIMYKSRKLQMQQHGQ